MGTTQRKEQRKMKLEKEIIRLTKLHQNKDKRELIQNINHVLRAQGIHLNRKVKWICKVTGSPEGTVYTWFTNARCRRENKIPLYALCQMALALRISVYEFFSADHFMEIAEKQKIDMRCKLYWHLRRNVAEDLWNGTHSENDTWQGQTLDIKREFLDELYLKMVNDQLN